MWRFHLLFAVASILGVDAHIPRDIMYSLDNIKGGILVKNGKRTSCELGVIDSQSSLVSAQCLDYTSSSSNEISPDTTYEVYLDTGIDGKAAKYTVENITVNPHYNAANNTNDVAIIQFNTGGSIEWQNIIVPDFTYSFDEVVYARRSLLDMDAMEWDTPRYYTTDINNNRDVCQGLSQIYNWNTDTISCGNYSLATPSVDLTACRVPYGVKYGLLNNQTHLIGLFSYAAISVYENLCNNNSYCSYYSMYARFVPYIEEVLGRSININAEYYGTNVVQTNASFYFDYMPQQDSRSTSFVRGDLFQNQADDITFIPSGSSSQSLQVSNNGPDDNDSSSVNGGGGGGGSSGKADSSNNRTAIIVGVCVPVVVLLVISCVLFVYFRKRHGRVIDTVGQREIQDALATDIGGAVVPGTPQENGGNANARRVSVADPPPIYESAESSYSTTSSAGKGVQDNKN
ncbi:hypothetical protein IWW50_000505 [Coemansia erecta]|nr:hypothetical protein IWW50_000505 [Coemansia erecta]